MISPGGIIEFIDGGKFHCGFVTGVAEKKIQLVSQNGREMSLATSRVLSVSQAPLSQPASREALTGFLQQCAAKRAQLAETVDLAELWEIVHQDADQDLAPELLADLLFGSATNDDQRAAFLRAIFADSLYFKFKNGLVATHTPEQVEQLHQQRQREAQKAQLLEQAVDGFQALHQGRRPDQCAWPDQDNCLKWLSQSVLFGNEAPEDEFIRQALKKAGLTAPHAGFELLVQAGVWECDENLALLRSDQPLDFSDACQEEATSLKEATLEELLADPKRKDLRDLNTLTIDGTFTRDFDDAVHVQRKEGGLIEVGIHITDVSYYVSPKAPSLPKQESARPRFIFPKGRFPCCPRISRLISAA